MRARVRVGARALAAMLAALAPLPAVAKVKEADAGGFTVAFVNRVAATLDAVWAALVQPSRWWSRDHSWSGDAAHFSLAPVAGGCFCERWETDDHANSVEHARIVYAVPGKQLRMVGAFGPLQGEALTGTMTVMLTREGDATIIAIDYVVGGHARFALADLAPAVDAVIGEQAGRLAALFPPAS